MPMTPGAIQRLKYLAADAEEGHERERRRAEKEKKRADQEADRASNEARKAQDAEDQVGRKDTDHQDFLDGLVAILDGDARDDTVKVRLIKEYVNDQQR